ncbi:MAG TPA: cyclopropane-fatty-acyl-phospholipid synthase family protein [Steroidobacteraceae bacterium]
MNRIELLTNELAGDRPAPGLLGLAERDWLPDWMIRRGIGWLCERRLRQERNAGPEQTAARNQSRIDELRRAPIAISTQTANEQHYELPPEFFRLVLGRRLKYSCAYFPRGSETLDQAEEAMLALYAERAELQDGQEILELGCGWGSLTMWMAERFPHARITAVSNSTSQKTLILTLCAERGLKNVRIITQDVNRLELPQQQYDRCVSIEMFEHMRNYEMLTRRISTWLRPGGKLFTHLFVNRDLLYFFETNGEDNWLGRHFFTGGLMPSADTLLWFQRNLLIESMWRVPGTHYERTANHWLRNQDDRREEVLKVLRAAYGPELAPLWFQRWRMFWMACAELFGYDRGREWFVAHYRFVRE